MSASKSANKPWNVYIVRCADGSLYTGIALSLNKRIEEHNQSNTGAKYTRARRPVKLAYSEACDTRSAASKREAAIKGLSRAQKEALIVADKAGNLIGKRNIKSL